ncbi:MAG: 1,2-phenylacetyl-CoA epoxidase subunit PaaD [Gemmatimonadaceae bacterium]
MVTSAATREDILSVLEEVKDPELPFIDVVELGIVRDVVQENGELRVDITPTYSGCPAIRVIESEIISTLNAHGFDNVRVNTILSPPWTTDWLSTATKEKFREYGIAPPSPVSDRSGIAELVSLRRARPVTICPFCGSSNTDEKSEFGSTACKSIHFCNGCHQPFDHFKAF